MCVRVHVCVFSDLICKAKTRLAPSDTFNSQSNPGQLGGALLPLAGGCRDGGGAGVWVYMWSCVAAAAVYNVRMKRYAMRPGCLMLQYSPGRE